MTRSLWKGPWTDVDPLAKQVWRRGATIVPACVGRTYQVHQGKGWTTVTVVPEMVGHRWGEFAVTRRAPLHKRSTSRGGKGSRGKGVGGQ